MLQNVCVNIILHTFKIVFLINYTHAIYLLSFFSANCIFYIAGKMLPLLRFLRAPFPPYWDYITACLQKSLELDLSVGI